MTTPLRSAQAAHESGLRAANAGHLDLAARLMREGLTQLRWRQRPGGDADDIPPEYAPHAARLLMSLALVEAEQGRAGYGLRQLDRAQRLAEPADQGTLLMQRGAILLRTGRWRDALAQLIAAEPLVAGRPDLLAGLLLNRGVLHLNTGDVDRARVDFRRGRDIADAAGLELLVAKTTHNLGYCDLLSGDVPAALHLFGIVAAAYRRIAPGLMPALETDRARALLAVGLADEAASELDSAIAEFRRQRSDQDCAEAELDRAGAALAAGDAATARRWAAAARRRFRARGNDAWAALAELTRLRAAAIPPPASPLASGPATTAARQAGPETTAARQAGPATTAARRARGYSPVRLAAEAQQLAVRLRGHRLRADAAHAELIATRALIAAGRPDEAARSLGRAGSRGLPLHVTLLRHLTRAEMAMASGRGAGGARPARVGQVGRAGRASPPIRTALAELRTGLAALHARRGQLGSFDLQAGTAALGTALADLGLRLVLEQGTPRQVFAWLEQSRAQAFRVRPVRPPDDPDETAALAELRQLGVLMRSAELNGAPGPKNSAARRAELQRQVRQYRRQSGGHGAGIEPATPAQVGAALADSGQVLAGIVVHEDRMLAIAIRGHAVRQVRLGDFAAATEAARRLTADLDALAGRNLPARLEAVIRGSVRHQTEVLDAEVITPLLPVIGDEGLVIIPVGALASVPWSMLPSLRGRPVTVSPSASSWLAAWQASARPATTGAAAPRPGSPGRRPAAVPVLVAGPDLVHAVPEVTEVAVLYSGSRPLVGAAATVDATLRSLDGAPLAHLAAHGHHDRDNVLFSSLDLADGPLMAYDVQRLETAPRQVVLSACDVGRSVVRPGDEVLGFTAALLHIGTATVISSVTRVADDITPGIMTAYHRALSAGSRPAEALAAACAREPLSPFVCFGAG
ncbi:MAG TPA: CHAT domain-containing protein [Trebonia sp.]|nr:CHAT domain-containing protein [Trebonia sp.]